MYHKRDTDKTIKEEKFLGETRGLSFMVRIKKISALFSSGEELKVTKTIPTVLLSLKNITHLTGLDSKHQGYLTE